MAIYFLNFKYSSTKTKKNKWIIIWDGVISFYPFFCSWGLDFKCQLPTPVARSISRPSLSDSDCHTILWPFAEQWPDTKETLLPLFEIRMRLNPFSKQTAKQFWLLNIDQLIIIWLEYWFGVCTICQHHWANVLYFAIHIS